MQEIIERLRRCLSLQRKVSLAHMPPANDACVAKPDVCRMRGALRVVSALQATKYRLCAPCAHFSQRINGRSQATCGYRNIQMMCWSLMRHPAYR